MKVRFTIQSSCNYSKFTNQWLNKLVYKKFIKKQIMLYLQRQCFGVFKGRPVPRKTLLINGRDENKNPNKPTFLPILSTTLYSQEKALNYQCYKRHLTLMHPPSQFDHEFSITKSDYDHPGDFVSVSSDCLIQNQWWQMKGFHYIHCLQLSLRWCPNPVLKAPGALTSPLKLQFLEQTANILSRLILDL